MNKLSFIVISSLASLTCSGIAAAYSCSDITNQIHKDISFYSDHIQAKRLPWMQLSWLKHELGTGEKDVLSANEVRYSWKCPDDDNNFLTVTKNKTGALVSFNGQYSSEDGSGSFSLDKTTIMDQGKQPATQPQKIKQTAYNTKTDLVKQFSSDLEEYS